MAFVPDFLCPVWTNIGRVRISSCYKLCVFIIRTYLGYVPMVLRLYVTRLVLFFLLKPSMLNCLSFCHRVYVRIFMQNRN